MARMKLRNPKGKVAIAGAGAIAVVHSLAAPAADLKVTAVASKGGSSARHLAGNIDARKVSLDALPAGAPLLIVATPPSSHEQFALQGLAAGADVLIEKPVAPTLAAADRLIDAAASPDAGRMLVAENLIHSPFWSVVMERRAELGRLGHLSGRVVQTPPEWGHFLQPLTDGGVLFDLGVHPVALMLLLADEPVVSVSAELSSQRSDGADDWASLRIRFASGLVAELETSWRQDPEQGEEAHWALQAASNDAVVRLEFAPEPHVEFNGDEIHVEMRHSAPDPRLESLGYVDQLIDFADRSSSRGQTLTQARDVLEVICAAYASAGNGGAEVTLPFDGDLSATPMQLWRGV